MNKDNKEFVLLIVSVLLVLGFLLFILNAIETNHKIVSQLSSGVLFTFCIVGIYKTLKSILL